jgi:hypothetical protein
VDLRGIEPVDLRGIEPVDLRGIEPVDHSCQNMNRVCTVQGPSLLVEPVRERRSSAS